MIRKLFLVVVMSFGCFWGARSEVSDEVEPLLKQIDFVLFILERNTLRMERYGLNELVDDTNYLSKDVSEEHCQFKISLSAPNFRAHSVFWDPDSFCRLKIVSGRKKNPEVYYLPLTKVVPEGVDLDDIALICFDCTVHAQKKSENSGRKTSVEVVVSACDGDLSTQLVLDGNVRAACGFFVQHDLFGDNLPLTGKIKREDALAKGILVANGILKSDNEKESEIMQEPQEIQVEPEVQQEAVEEVVAPEKKPSWFIVQLLMIKNFFGNVWTTVMG